MCQVTTIAPNANSRVVFRDELDRHEYAYIAYYTDAPNVCVQSATVDGAKRELETVRNELIGNR